MKLSTGCTVAKNPILNNTTPISDDTLSFFNKLQNQTFWMKNPVTLQLQDVHGKTIVLSNSKHLANWRLVFADLKILKKDKDGHPTVAVIASEVYPESQYHEFLVNKQNQKALEIFIANAISTDQKYSALIESAKQYIEKGKWDNAITVLQKALNMKRTDKAESLLASVYYYKGRSFYRAGDYNSALVWLGNVKYNQSWIKAAKALIATIKAKQQAEKEAKIKAQKEKLARIRRELTVDKDEFRQVTFYQHYRSVPKYMSLDHLYLFPYIGVNKSHKWYFLCFEAYMSEWLFANKVYAIVGGKHYETPAYNSFDPNVTHKVVDGGVIEKVDFDGSDPQVDALVRAVVNAPLGTTIKFRIDGTEGYKEFTMTREEQQEWKDVMYFYDYGIKKPASP